MIEEVSGKKIAEIFEQDGEETFREMETQILQACLLSAHNRDRRQLACSTSSKDGILLRYTLLQLGHARHRV